MNASDFLIASDSPERERARRIGEAAKRRFMELTGGRQPGALSLKQDAAREFNHIRNLITGAQKRGLLKPYFQSMDPTELAEYFVLSHDSNLARKTMHFGWKSPEGWKVKAGKVRPARTPDEKLIGQFYRESRAPRRGTIASRIKSIRPAVSRPISWARRYPRAAGALGLGALGLGAGLYALGRSRNDTEKSQWLISIRKIHTRVPGISVPIYKINRATGERFQFSYRLQKYMPTGRKINVAREMKDLEKTIRKQL